MDVTYDKRSMYSVKAMKPFFANTIFNLNDVMFDFATNESKLLNIGILFN